jgi:hypothetical protein
MAGGSVLVSSRDGTLCSRLYLHRVDLFFPFRAHDYDNSSSIDGLEMYSAAEHEMLNHDPDARRKKSAAELEQEKKDLEGSDKYFS